MNINWYGQSCFRITTQKNKGEAVDILIDPLDKEQGLRGPKLEADILLVSSEDQKVGPGPYFLISGPGEYDIKGAYIQGIVSQNKKNTIYTIETEEMRICHLGKLDQKELSSDQLDIIGDIDILMIPVGGGEVLGAAEAIKIMAQIEPKITIPMHYKIPNLKIKMEGLDNFLKSLGIKSLEPLPKLSIKKKDISLEEAKIIILQP